MSTQTPDLRAAAQAVIDRWDTPKWKDVPATAGYIGRLRAALAAGQATAAKQAPECPSMPETWHVVAHVLGEPILSIGYDWLSGKGELTEAETQAVIGMAQHMLAFVGYGLPPSSFDPDADEATAAQAVVPAGWKLVPTEPTHNMLAAMAECDGWLPGDRDRPGLTRWEDYWRMAIAAAPPQPAAQQGAAYAAPPSHEHQLAIMEGERNASLDAYSRVVYLTSAESRLYERAFTSGWDRRDRLASYGQAPAQAAPAAVAGPSEAVKFTDQSTADPVEKARRYLTAMGDQRTNSAYFYDDGYPRRESAQDALATLAVLEQLAAAPTTQPAPVAPGESLCNDPRLCCRSHPHEDQSQHCQLREVAAWLRWLASMGRVPSAESMLDRAEKIDSVALAIAAPAAQGDALDAERWRMAALVGNEVMVHPDKRNHAAAVAAYMQAVSSGLDLTAAIDAARAAQGGK